MSFPPSVVAIPVHGLITSLEGVPAKGWVSFELPGPLRDSGANIVLAPLKYAVDLDVNGEFTILLPATDSPDLSPQNWSYRVYIGTDVLKDSFYAHVPASTIGTLEFADMVPAELPGNTAAYALLGHTHLAFPVRNLTFSSNVVTDVSTGNHFRLTLTGNATLAKPIKADDGQRCLWEFTQDSVGNRILTLDSSFDIGPYASIGGIVLSTAPHARDWMGAVYKKSIDKWDVLPFGKGYGLTP